MPFREICISPHTLLVELYDIILSTTALIDKIL